MAYFLRLIPTWAWFVVGCLLGGVPQFAFADTYPPTTTYSEAFSGTYVPIGVFCSTKLSAPANNGYYVDCHALVNGGLGWEGIRPSGEVRYFSHVVRSECLYGGTLSNGQCVNAPPCPTGQTRDSVTGECLAPPNPCEQHAGKYWGDGNQDWRTSKPWEPSWMSGDGGTGLPSLGCWNQCEVDLSERDFGGSGSGKWYMSVYIKATGNACAPGAATPEAPPKPPETSPEYDCAKAGQGWGTVNGTVVCTGPTTNKTSEKTDTAKTTNPDATTTETKTTEQCQGATCTETKTTTNCDAAGNNCTTSTTTTEKTGTGEGGEGEGDEPESKWGGNCASGFACSGDAIQCAIAKEQHIRNCELEPSQANKDKGQNVIDGVLEANDPRRPENKASEAFGNWSAEGGMAGSCPADFSVQLYGQTIVVPWSDLCPHFTAMGYAMLAVAWVIAAGVLRGVL